MSISIKEYCGVNNVVTSRDTTKEIPMKESTAVSDYIAPTADTLMVEIEGIHAYPYHTRNYTRYMPEALKESQFKWTHPYLKPLIKHHNDQNGEIIGRIYDATYSEKTSIDNVGGLYFTVSVPDKKAEYEVENRLLETVSIGISTNDVRCSICGSPIIDAEEGCPNNHVRGAKYDGETCYWDIYNIEPKELSYVIVPSDAYAKNVTFYRAKDKNSKSTALHESLDNKLTNNNKTDNNIGGSSLNMDLEKQLAEVQEENSKLKAELEAAKASLAELEEVKAAKAELEKTLDEVKKAVEEKTAEVENLEAKVKVSEEDLAAAHEEKEAAEKAGLEAQEQLRSVVQDMFNQYRKLTGRKEFAEAEFANRTTDSLLDSITDFKEELCSENNKLDKVIQVKEQHIPNPVAPTNKQPVKSKKDNDRMNLEEQFNNLFVAAVSK